jgi:hypothetical protein
MSAGRRAAAAALSKVMSRIVRHLLAIHTHHEAVAPWFEGTVGKRYDFCRGREGASFG